MHTPTHLKLADKTLSFSGCVTFDKFVGPQQLSAYWTYSLVQAAMLYSQTPWAQCLTWLWEYGRGWARQRLERRSIQWWYGCVYLQAWWRTTSQHQTASPSRWPSIQGPISQIYNTIHALQASSTSCIQQLAYYRDGDIYNPLFQITELVQSECCIY